MRFGVSEHLGPSYGWFAPSHGYDQFNEPGAQLGVPYDGADPKYQELYHPDNNEPFRWGPSWYATNSAWHQEWFNRIKDLLDQYQPDLLYTDGGIPFGEVGRSLLAHFYNANEAAHGGQLEAVYNFKNMGTGEFIRHAGVEDVERGVMKDINPLPWQTCTSMGDWFYSDGFKYKTTAEVVHMLADIVSKNGNMLLNVVLYADGSLPPESRQFLDEMAAWMVVNGEAIHGTRPWKIFGEGPTVAKAGHFKEDTAYTPQDIRFTTKGGKLYAIALGWPAEGKVVITSLAKTDDASVNQIERVELLGGKGELKFTQTATGLTVELPAQKTSDIACTLKITGGNLQPVKSSALASAIRPKADGMLILSAATARLHGSELRLETQGGLPDIGFWMNGEEWVSWLVQIPQAVVFKVSATVATLDADNSFVVEVGDKKISAQVPVTGGWDDFQTNDLGQVEIQQPGELMVKVRASDAASWRPINLNSVQLTPVAGLTGAAASAVRQAEILTPPAPDGPRVNGPSVFGVRPGSPFLFSIPATGKRPMKFSAKGLPKGLKLDADTGRITGALKKAGEFTVKLQAKNALGTAEKSFRIVVGEGIALTPPRGWNSWNCWGDKVDADKVLRSARALVASGLDQHGWSHINIDDAWQGARSGPINALQPDPKRFPDMKRLCDEIHNLGLKPASIPRLGSSPIPDAPAAALKIPKADGIRTRISKLPKTKTFCRSPSANIPLPRPTPRSGLLGELIA
jgi:alpha-L-fucosidase